MAIRSPDRACARASVQPQNRPYTASPAGTIWLVSNEPLPSRSWRT